MARINGRGCGAVLIDPDPARPREWPTASLRESSRHDEIRLDSHAGLTTDARSSARPASVTIRATRRGVAAADQLRSGDRSMRSTRRFGALCETLDRPTAASSSRASSAPLGSEVRTGRRPLIRGESAKRVCRFKRNNVPYRLLDDACDDAGADGAAAFANSEAQLFFHRDRRDQLDFNGDVVARHDHFRAFRQRHDASHVRRAEVELRTVAFEERSMTAAFFFGQDVGFSLELLVRRDRAWLSQNLAALNFFILRTTEKNADVVAGATFVEELRNISTPVTGRLGRRTDADDFDFFANLDDTALDTAGDDCSTTRDREHVFDRHQERLVDRTLGRRDVGVDSFHQLEDRIFADLLVRRLREPSEPNP